MKTLTNASGRRAQLLQCAVCRHGDAGINRAELFFIAPDVLLQGLQQAFSMPGGENDARNQLTERSGVLLNE